VPIGDGYGVVAPADRAHVLKAREFAEVPGLEGVDVAVYVHIDDLDHPVHQVEDSGGHRVDLVKASLHPEVTT
jgi:hypothetical protein